MSGETVLTFIGNLTADPELRFTQSGTAVAGFTVVARESRLGDGGEWQDSGEPLFLRCSAWREPFASNIAESLIKGDRLVVTGRLRARSWVDKDENKRTTMELDVIDVGASVRFNRVRPVRRARADQEATAAEYDSRVSSRSSASAGVPVSDTAPF